MEKEQHQKGILPFIFRAFPFLGHLCRYLLDILANILIYVSNKVGRLYTFLFSFLGTSWFDHRYDYLMGINNYHWLERAFWVLPKIYKGDTVLDIGSGDGIFTGIFYSDKAKSVLAIDINKDAVSQSKKYYSKSNVIFLKKDLLKWNIPVKKYDVVILFSVIEHFTAKDGQAILSKIKKSLKSEGVLFGSTPIFSELGVSNWEHKNEFTSNGQLKLFLKQVFSNVKMSESMWTKKRPECYFECR